MTTAPGQRSMLERMVGAAKLENDAYEEVEHDSEATTQAAIVVAMVAVAQAIGAVGQGVSIIFVAVLSALLTWLLWSGITYLIGDKLLGGTATWGELLRTLGFAQSPGVLYIFAGIPGLGWLVRTVVGIWILVAGIIAIRQACDFGTGRAIATAVLGWLIVVVPLLLLPLMLRPLLG